MKTIKFFCYWIEDIFLTHKKQITDIIALIIVVLGVMDLNYGAPTGQILIKIAVAALCWFSGRKKEEII